jgi:hypothetical protein
MCEFLKERFWMKLFTVVAVVAAFFLLVPAVGADVVYTYVGNSYTSVNGSGGGQPFTTSNNVTITLTFGSALGGSLALGTVTPTTWTVTDGNTFWQPGPGYSLAAMLATDALGHITQWSIGFSNGLIQSGFYQIVSSNSGDASHTFFGDGSNSNNPGTWSSQVVLTPEPATLILLGTGVALGFARSRKFRLA